MNTARTAFRILCFSILILAILEVALMNPARSEAETKDGGHHDAPAQKPQKTEDPQSMVARELEDKRLSVEARARQLEDQEARLKEREKEIDRKLKEMEHLRASVSGELDAQRKNNEEKVVKMVQVFETMSPKSASAVMETLDDWLAVEVLKRMDIKKVAKMMNIMEKSRSAKLSEMLTGYYRPENDKRFSAIKANLPNQIAKTAQAESTERAPASSTAAAAPPSVPQTGLKPAGQGITKPESSSTTPPQGAALNTQTKGGGK